ncbi:gamma-glutamylcyclotransferase family protein [Streptomyces sp. NPDC000594]|uniref:gamma-glutamylcyclotransferase family protein n=1 Tax=Streptomyces sp. NPDC000594 TaxID=3154261 RepID=UPI00332C14FE
MRGIPELPFFVYGTLRPGEANHARHLLGRTVAEEPARWPGAVLYEGPGYPWALERPGAPGGPAEAGGTGDTGVAGELVTAAPGSYRRVLADLDALEEFLAPGDPRNLYERVTREVRRADGTPVRAWVYLTAPGPAAALRGGTPIPGGDWLARPVR